MCFGRVGENPRIRDWASIQARNVSVLLTLSTRRNHVQTVVLCGNRREGGHEESAPDGGRGTAAGGVLIFGDRGTGKSNAVRALAELLPKIETRTG